MWNNNNQRSLLVPEEEVVVGNNVDSFDNTNNLFGLQHHHTSSAQVSLNFNNNQRSSSLGRSQSLGSVKHQSSINQSSRVNEAFGHPYFSQAGRRFNAPAAQQSNSNRPFERLIPSSRNNNSNPFLGNPKVSSILAAATASSSFATANSTAFSSTSTSSPLFLHSLQKPQQLQPCNISGASISSSSSTDDKSPPISPTPPPNINYASDSTTTQNNNKNITCTGPTELYRLIASPPHEVSSPNWNVILQRAKSHPHEACFYDSNAGGHVYALHRLLRHTGEECCDNNDMDEEEDGCEGCRPPVEVVEAVMKACPRAITRKQAMLDEDEEDLIMSDGNTEGENGNGGSNMQAEHGQPLQNNLNIPPPNNGENAMQNGGNQEPQGEHEDNQNIDHDDVRFEYPLAIACECEQDGEVVRLLASYLAKSKPVYRSEVFRSLDYASLPTHLVRILLEEYAGCVLERGMNSEVTEGDDDDCPLEQIMFWWDDPDMLNMEEEIMSYPNCNMKDDLCDLYAKLSMMLYAATNGTMVGYDESKGSFQVLHHLLHIVSEGGIKGVHFPNDFAHAVLLLSKFIQKERVTMFEERDDSGSLPLHIAVSGKKLLKPKNDPQLTAENAETNDIVEGNENVNQEAGGQPEEEGMNVAEPEVGEAQQQQNDNGPQHPQAAEQQEEVEPPEQEDEDEEDDDDEEEEDNAAEEEIDRSAMDIEIVKLLLDHHPASIRLRDAQSGSLPLHLALQHNPRATDAIEHFLYLHPRSVTMPDGNGRLPLHLALIRESPTWESVLNLSPTTLETRDPVTGLLPFQLAAMSKSDNSTLENDAQEGGQESDDGGELESLSTCFSLLRMSPCLANGLAIVKPRPQSLIEQQIMGRYKPRVTKLEEENESLRRKVEDLERELQSLKMERGSKGVHCTQSGSPHLKKRKSSSP